MLIVAAAGLVVAANILVLDEYGHKIPSAEGILLIQARALD